MKKVAHHDGIEIFAPDDARFSFLKSPYAAHKTNSAVDIYYGSFGSEALSPVDGKVIDIRSFDTPTPYKGLDSFEYLIAIEEMDHAIKIIHVKPEVKIGEYIKKGDTIGTFIKNGYFIFWNDPVMHVEVRKHNDYLRASNNLQLTPAVEWDVLPSGKTAEFECIVETVKKSYALLSAPFNSCGEGKGFSIDGGFIDGYISSGEDGFFGIVREEGFIRPETAGLEIRSKGREMQIGGAAFSLSFNEPKIKIIPQRYGEKLFSRGEEVFIRLEIP